MSIWPDMLSAGPAGDTTPSGLAAKVIVTAHLSMLGDRSRPIGEWVGDPLAQRAIEGIALVPADGTLPEALPVVEYQLVYKHDIMTSWTAMPHFCGSRGLDLACIGIRFRIPGDQTGAFVCSYDAGFADGTRRDGVSGGEIAIAPSEAPLTAVRVEIESTSLAPGVLPSAPGYAPPGGENDYDDDTVCLRLLSPAFDARPPEIRNPDLIPAEPRHAMELSWSRPLFSERPLRFRVIEEALVVREGLVFDRNLATVQSSRLHFSDADVACARSDLESARQAGHVRRVRGTSLLCKSPAAANYGHYLVEMFPKAWLGNTILRQQQPAFIVDQSDMMMIVAESLIRIGIKPRDIVWAGNEPLACDRLITIEGMTFHGQYQSPLCGRALSELASGVTAGTHAKLFVRRQSHTRPLVNEEAVQAVFETNGFRVIEPGMMSLKEQIACFKGATTVVASLGAALTNIAFCPSGAKIVALTSASFPDTFFWFQSQHRRHDYLEIRCKDVRDFDLDQQSWNAGFAIGEADLRFLASL